MKLLSLLLALSLLSISLALGINFQTASDGKVKINVYYQPLCSLCQYFIHRSIKTAIATKDFWKICQINLLPFGKAKLFHNKAGWNFKCMNGPTECHLNKVSICALKLFPSDYYSKSLPFIACLQQDTYNWQAQGPKCATNFGLNWQNIVQCSNSEQSNNWQVEAARQTLKIAKGLIATGGSGLLPWISVDGKVSAQIKTAVSRDIVSFVCKNYKGNVKIAACLGH